MILQIIKNPNSILRAKAKDLLKENIVADETQRLILDMIETMREKEGIGLAAPQVNKSLRIICIDTIKNDSRGSITEDILPQLNCTHGERAALVLINPEITWESMLKNYMDEGCLSVPGKNGKVKRPKAIRIKCKNIKGETVKFKATKLFARVLQHEIDHLDGILFIDKL
ncbi:MAG: peptide deformylase [bacterium]